MQTDSTNSTNKLATFENLLKLTPIFTAAILAISITYDSAYLWALGLSLADIPSSISEHIRSALLWSPLVLALCMMLGIVHTFSNQFDAISNKSVNYVRTISVVKKMESKNPFLLLYGMIFLTIGSMIAASIITKEFGFLFFAAGYFWVCIIMKYVYEIEKKTIKPLKIIGVLYFFPILLFCVGGFGFYYGGKLLRSNTQKWEYVIKKEDKENVIKVFEQRRFTEFTIAVIDSQKNILIIPNSNILSVKSLRQ